MTDGGEWLSITDAAKRLTAEGDAVDRSTLSRYVSQHAEALATRRDGKSNLVELGALRLHRNENVRLRRAVPMPSSPQQASPSSSPSGSRFPGSQADGAARKAQADAEMRELDLAERRGELTPVSEVDKAGRDAVALMMSAFDRALDSEAASASVKYSWDERIVRLVLKAYARRGLDVFHGEVLKMLDGIDRAEMAAAQGDDSAVEAPLQ
ncbi:hypothetical protein RPPS3_25620 [Rhodopseudomonas palustris]|uniref:hypothetical protein n=1 Tax=Rhodopseudomonas palustris TaxID=1076 RepID=UPI000D1B96CC|nr:hypothetical protein [Rhodopseudomonas palustris]AVT76625.1 hypothetical protein RPPS3_25620 [Rhodopseudomonas palustris]